MQQGLLGRISRSSIMEYHAFGIISWVRPTSCAVCFLKMFVEKERMRNITIWFVVCKVRFCRQISSSKFSSFSYRGLHEKSCKWSTENLMDPWTESKPYLILSRLLEHELTGSSSQEYRTLPLFTNVVFVSALERVLGPLFLPVYSRRTGELFPRRISCNLTRN